jgi:hypothetical protein
MRTRYVVHITGIAFHNPPCGGLSRIETGKSMLPLSAGIHVEADRF